MIDYRRALRAQGSAKSPTSGREVSDTWKVGLDTLTHGVEKDLRMMFDALMAFASVDECQCQCHACQHATMAGLSTVRKFGFRVKAAGRRALSFPQSASRRLRPE